MQIKILRCTRIFVLALACSAAIVEVSLARDLDLPKTNPFDNSTLVKRISNSMDEVEVQRLIEQRIDLLMRDSADVFGLALPGEGNLITQQDVLRVATYIGVVNGQRVYRDEVQGCYIYESIENDLDASEVVESRCYHALLDRLRIDATTADAANSN